MYIPDCKISLSSFVFLFPSSLGPLYQNEVKCSAFDMEMIFHSHANKTNFRKKGCALGLILKERVLKLGSIFTSPCGDGTAMLSIHPSHAKVQLFAGQMKHLHSSVILRPWVLVRSRESNPWPPAQRLSALPTELNLPRLSDTLTVFRPGGGVWSPRREKNWITSNLFKLWTPNLAAFPTNLSGNILKSSWRVCQHWCCHGNRVFTAMFFKICSFPINRISVYFYLSNYSITVNLAIFYEFFYVITVDVMQPF